MVCNPKPHNFPQPRALAYRHWASPDRTLRPGGYGLRPPIVPACVVVGLTLKRGPCGQDEWGLSQTGFPDSGGARVGAFFPVGNCGARALFFWNAAFAAIVSGSGAPASVPGERWEVGATSAAPATPTPRFAAKRFWPTLAEDGIDSPELRWFASRAATVNSRSASSQIAVSCPLGLPRPCQISWARRAMAS